MNLPVASGPARPFESLHADRRTPGPWSALAAALSYSGPERRGGQALVTRLLALMLDEVDYGLMLVGEGDLVLHVNHAARAELDEHHPLQLVGRHVRARLGSDHAALTEALQMAAQRGLRRLLNLGGDAVQVGVSVVPLPSAALLALPVDAKAQHPILLVLGKRQMCATLSVQGFARAHRLTQCEERVLLALCEGRLPTEIAADHGVKIATVRTQIANIRSKTGASGIRELVRQVAVLPPQRSALRHCTAQAMPIDVLHIVNEPGATLSPC